MGLNPIKDTSSSESCTIPGQPTEQEKINVGGNCRFVYFGINKGNTSLDLVKEKYNV